MKIVRWILFLPVALVALAVAQIITAGIADRFSWFGGVAAMLLVGSMIALFSCASIRIAPDPKIGATIVLTVFLLLEVFALRSVFNGQRAVGIAIRLYTDVVIVIGAVVAARIKEL